jgi:hypothetical protein
MEGRTVGKGNFAGGFGVAYNLPSSTLGALTSGAKDYLDHATPDTLAPTATDFASGRDALLAYSLDPVGMTTDLGLRYGLLDNLDLQYHYTSGGHVFGLQWMAWHDAQRALSLGARYSSASYELPSLVGKLQGILGYEFTRRDVLLPVAYGFELGEGGSFGSANIGAALQLSQIHYGFKPDGLYSLVDSLATPLPDVPASDVTYLGYGLFGNAHLGYKVLFLVPSFSAFYQDYGRYAAPNADLTTGHSELSGFTAVVGLGIEIRMK